MNVLRFCVYANVLLAATVTPAVTQTPETPRIVRWNCSGCHGLTGNAQPPYLPRVAGLSAAYEQRRIAEFRGTATPHIDEAFYRLFLPHREATDAGRQQARINMVGIAHALTPEEIQSSTAWYASQTADAGRAGNAALIAAGKLLYLGGMPSQKMLACQTCHGADAQGKSGVPRLAGQNGDYVIREMAKFKAGDRKHAPEMTVVTEHVDDDQFRALAAYLQSL